LTAFASEHVLVSSWCWLLAWSLKEAYQLSLRYQSL
jgi:hypothetical protein